MTRSLGPGRRASLIAATLGAALAVGGCAAIPDSGPVGVGLPDLEQAEQIVQYGAPGPVAGATQEQLVRGFLTAANAPADDYAIAREYLTPGYASQWDPYFGALIGDGSRPYRTETEQVGTLSFSVSAKVDETGKMLPVEAGASTELRFGFTKWGGEWRISSAPSGVILDRVNFLAIWSSHQLYFLGPGDRLVPDTRWFLSNTGLATAIVSSLLDGPGERFDQSVHSGFPPGVRLTKGTVPVVDGLARVDLTGEGLGNEKAQQEMLAQLQASLQSVQGVNRVELLVDGSVVRGGAEPMVPNQPNSAGTKLAGMIDDRFGVISGETVEPITGVSQAVEDLDASGVSSVALSRSKTVAAVINGSGATITSDGYVAVIDARKRLLQPSVDDDLWAWTLSAADPTIVRVSAANGLQHEFAAPWLADVDARAMRVAPGGSQIAVLASEGDKSYVLVAGIIRDSDGTPTGLTQEADIEMWASGEAIDLDWVDQVRFVTLTRQANAGKVTVGGPGLFAGEQGSVPDAVAVVGGGSRAGMRVLSGDGDLFAPQGGSEWQRVASGIELLAKRG